MKTGTLLSFLAIAALLSGCSTGKKKTDPELSELEGKKVALVEIQAETTARAIIEVALVNQLVKHGSFILLSEKEIESAKKAPDQDPTDWQGIARRAGADYALKAEVVEFKAEETESYSAVEEEDSQLAAERGDGKTQRLYKIHTLNGSVKIQLNFSGVTPESERNHGMRSAIAEATKTLTEAAKDQAAHLPPKLRFLEELTNTAFSDFFEKYD